MNSYQTEIDTNPSLFNQFNYRYRHELVVKYAWAIPDDEVINTIVKYSPIIEVGAGTGYWASLIAEQGGDILAFDISPYTNCQANNQHYLVQQAEESIVKNYSNRSLFLCWPPYKEPMAHDCLKNYKGDTLIYIGEFRGGCTADNKFFDLLEKEWELIEEQNIPQWETMHDYLSIYKRK